MIELKNNKLEIAFPEVHNQAHLTIDFQRTLRLPDDSKTYPLPPGFGSFPLVHVDDYADNIPESWLDRGGLIMPMYQAEALWLHFFSEYIFERGTFYPFAIKVYTGKINAVTGNTYAHGLNRNPQDYLVAPDQPWIDGYCVAKGLIKQFVATALGDGYTAEEQLTGQADIGGLQLVVYPMKAGVFERQFPRRPELEGSYRSRDGSSWGAASGSGRIKHMSMGLAPGGLMKQTINKDRFDLNDWDLSAQSRCFIHIANSKDWLEITGQHPPMRPPTAADYTTAGLPWFDYYDADAKALKGSKTLNKLKSVFQMNPDNALPENESCTPNSPIKLRSKDAVREGKKDFWGDLN